MSEALDPDYHPKHLIVGQTITKHSVAGPGTLILKILPFRIQTLGPENPRCAAVLGKVHHVPMPRDAQCGADEPDKGAYKV